MKKNATIFLFVGMFICSATVAANEANNNGSVAGIMQSQDELKTWYVAIRPNAEKEDVFKKYPVSKFTVQNSINLKKWGIIEEEVVEKTVNSPEQTVVLKQKKESIKSRGLFDFYKPIKKLVAQKINNNTITVKVVTEKEDTAVGIILIIWIVLLLILYFFLIIGFKRNNTNLLFVVLILTIFTVCASAFVMGPVVIAIAIASIATVASVAAVTITAVDVKLNKKAMFIISFLYYIVSLLLFYAVSDIQHTIILAIAIPLVYASTWRFVEYKNKI